MGCGGSKGTAAAEHPSLKPFNPPPPPTTHHYYNAPTYNTTSYPLGHSTQYPNFGSTHQGRELGNSLPPPRPPDQTLEELLAGKEDLMRKSDLHAQGVSFDKAIQQDLNEFTGQTLIPKGTVEEKETVQIVDNRGNQNVVTQPASSPKARSLTPQIQHEAAVNGPQNVDFSSPPIHTEKDNVDAAELLLEKHKRDTEKAKNLMMVDKMRHNITLQDKLAKRKEMKRRAVLAKGAVVAGEISDEIAAKQQRAEGEDAEAGMVATALAEGSSAAFGEATMAMNDATLDGEMEAAQDKFDAVMAEAAPKPVAPETRKEAIYGNEDNIELFKDLEEFAVNMEQISSPETTFAVLMKSLLINQLSDLEKVRILFHWITKQDLNSISFPSNITEDTPMGFLFAIKNGSKTYAELFSRLCSAAGLHAKVITGYLKGVGYLPDYKFIGAGDPFRGSWNAVLINGQWRLIDTHWGARHVVEDDDSVTPEQVTVYRYEEHYFLTNPDQLIVTHFPDEQDWQLLQQPVTLEQFQDFTKLWPLHYKVKLSLHSHPNGLIIAPSDGILEIRIKTSEFARRDAELKSDFMTKTKKRKVGDVNLFCCVFHYIEKEFQVFRVCCPEAGEYLLKIFGLSQKFSEGNVFTNIALYQINCPRLKRPELTPKDPLNVKPSELVGPFAQVNTPWGPPSMMRAYQILPMSHAGPIVCCDKFGEASLAMQLQPGQRLNFLQQLFIAGGGSSASKEPLANRAVHSITTSHNGRNVVLFQIRTPERGNYTLSLYMSDKSEGTFDGFCNYFVISAAQSHPAPSFPNVPNGALGENEENCLALNMSPTAYPSFIHKGIQQFVQNPGNGWIGLTVDYEGYVIMDHINPTTIIAQLEGNEGADFSRNVLVEDTEKRSVIAIRPPKAMKNSPEYALKVYAAPAGQTSNIPPVLTSFISGSQKEPKLFPKSPARRWGLNPAESRCGLSLVSVSSTSPLFNVDANHDGQEPSPCRIYEGGSTMTVKLAMKYHFVLKAILSVDRSDGLQQLEDDSTFFSELTASEATLSVRIPGPGDYCLSVYGGPVTGGGNQLSVLLHLLIHAKSGTVGAKFPRSFGQWNSGLAKIHSPVNGYLKRNTVNKVKVTFGDLSQGVVKAFPRVILLTDQSHPVEPSATDNSSFTYEWDYAPGPGEKMISLVVQKSQGDSSLAYVLQFDITD